MMQVLVNGEPAATRILTPDEQARIDAQKEISEGIYERRKAKGEPNPGRNLNLRRQLHVFMLEPPAPKDDLAVGDTDSIPEDVEEVWVQWKVLAAGGELAPGMYNVKLWGR